MGGNVAMPRSASSRLRRQVAHRTEAWYGHFTVARAAQSRVAWYRGLRRSGSFMESATAPVAAFARRRGPAATRDAEAHWKKSLPGPTAASAVSSFRSREG